MTRLLSITAFHLFVILLFTSLPEAAAKIESRASVSLSPGNAVIDSNSGDVVYIYDELGRLRAVVDSTGDTAIYSYDAVAICSRSLGRVLP